DSPKGRKFQEELEASEELGKRAIELAGEGIPKEGAVYLLRNDPKTEGPKLFQKNCATCHTHGNDFENKNPTAPDLEGFGTRAWNYQFLLDPGSKKYL